MTAPLYTPTEATDRETFLGLMWALSHPGRVQTLDSSADLHALFIRIGAALLDLETSFYTPDAALEAELLRTGARALPPADAAYHFYPMLDEPALDAIAQASVGTMLRPDESATLIAGCAFASGSVFEASGPGIQGTTEIRLGGVPARFWSLRTKSIRYPLGWDIYFVDHGSILGLPRTTQIAS